MKRERARGNPSADKTSGTPVQSALDDALYRLSELEERYAAMQRENLALLQMLARYADSDAAPMPPADAPQLVPVVESRPEHKPKPAVTVATDTKSAEKVKAAEEAAALLRKQLEQIEEELERELLNRVEAMARAEKAEGALGLLAEHNLDAVAWRSEDFVEGDERLRLTLEQAILGGCDVARIGVEALRNDEGAASMIVRSEQLRHERILVGAHGGLWRTNGQPLFLDQQERRIVRGALIALQRIVAERRPSKANAWLKSFESMRKGLDAKAEGWRASRVVLRAVQVNPGYEHLWFELEGASFGEGSWPVFQFRLGAASVRKGGFSTHPRLEFPLQAPAPHQFEKWFDECEDEHGPKLELRFDLRRGAADLDVWGELSAGDQRALAGLLAELPAWIAHFYPGHPAARRPAAEWINLARDVADLLHARDMAAGGTAFA